MVVAGLADGDEGGNGVADDGHADEAIPGLGDAGQFEGERIDFTPFDQTRERQVGHDGDDECFVDAVAVAQALQAAFGVDVCVGTLDQVGVLVRDARQMQCGDYQIGRGDVRVAEVGVAEAAVGVLLFG